MFYWYFTSIQTLVFCVAVPDSEHVGDDECCSCHQSSKRKGVQHLTIKLMCSKVLQSFVPDFNALAKVSSRRLLLFRFPNKHHNSITFVFQKSYFTKEGYFHADSKLDWIDCIRLLKNSNIDAVIHFYEAGCFRKSQFFMSSMRRESKIPPN